MLSETADGQEGGSLTTPPPPEVFAPAVPASRAPTPRTLRPAMMAALEAQADPRAQSLGHAIPLFMISPFQVPLAPWFWASERRSVYDIAIVRPLRRSVCHSGDTWSVKEATQWVLGGEPSARRLQRERRTSCAASARGLWTFPGCKPPW